MLALYDYIALRHSIAHPIPTWTGLSCFCPVSTTPFTYLRIGRCVCGRSMVGGWGWVASTKLEQMLLDGMSAPRIVLLNV